jgi:hypothetical protein
MRYSTFEQAAVEASAAVKEIDAEIQRLMAKRDLLETLAHQLKTVLPALAVATQADAGNQAGAPPNNPAVVEQPVQANVAAESQTPSTKQDQWMAYAAATPPPEAPAAQRPSYAELLEQSKPYSLRNEGWPSTTPADQREFRQLL